MDKVVAWIDGDGMNSEAYRIEMQIAGAYQWKVFRQADLALQALSERDYPLVVVNPRLAPGHNYPGELPPDWKEDPDVVGIDFVRKVKELEGYDKVPLLAIVWDERRGRFFGPLESKLLEAGANAVVPLIDVTPEEFFSEYVGD